MSPGQLCMVLHAHLPFVRHPEYEDFFEEGWLHEAILESYIPLLWVLEGLAERGVPYRITFSLSPTLVAMLNDPLLRLRFVRRMERLCELTEREVRRTRHSPELYQTALLYRERFARARRDYEEHWRRDLAGAFRRLVEAGHVELITCAATHGYLPLLNQNPLAVRAQVLVAVAQHRACFGSPAHGLWLPECGYSPGLDGVLHEAGIRYTFVETHAIEHASGPPLYSVYAPLYCPSGVAVFGRDPESSRQVWSSAEGYPGDPDYREYYRDIGLELDLDYLGSCAHPLGIRRNLGIKYHRVTGATETKGPYDRARALARTAEHALDFCRNRREQVQWLCPQMDREPVVVSPYDAELFGHWWFEGPEWLGHVLRNLAQSPQLLSLVTPTEYLATHPTNQVATPSPSSWGYRGYNEMWLNGHNDWIYPHLHEAADRMVTAAGAHPSADGLERAALNQAARELLLAQASDWAFIMTQGTVVPYAVRRTKEHLSRLHRLVRMVERHAVDAADLAAIQGQDNLFPDIDYRVYRPDYELGMAERAVPQSHSEPEVSPSPQATCV
jgi:1,4-alpha-glucan branching enzyme